MEKKLQVKINSRWEWVFSFNNGKIVTTDNKRKALPQGAQYSNIDLKYFKQQHYDKEFRLHYKI